MAATSSTVPTNTHRHTKRNVFHSTKLSSWAPISHQNRKATIQHKHSINESYKATNNSNPKRVERVRERGKFSKFSFQSPTKATKPKQQNHGSLLGSQSPSPGEEPKRSSALTGVTELEEPLHICTAQEKTPHQSHESTKPGQNQEAQSAGRAEAYRW